MNTLPVPAAKVSWLRQTGRLGLVCFAYVVTGWIGLKLPYYGSHITLIWLPSGIAVAALVRWGRTMWLAVAPAASTNSVCATLPAQKRRNDGSALANPPVLAAVYFSCRTACSESTDEALRQ